MNQPQVINPEPVLPPIEVVPVQPQQPISEGTRYKDKMNGLGARLDAKVDKAFVRVYKPLFKRLQKPIEFVGRKYDSINKGRLSKKMEKISSKITTLTDSKIVLDLKGPGTKRAETLQEIDRRAAELFKEGRVQESNELKNLVYKYRESQNKFYNYSAGKDAAKNLNTSLERRISQSEDRTAQRTSTIQPQPVSVELPASAQDTMPLVNDAVEDVLPFENNKPDSSPSPERNPQAPASVEAPASDPGKEIESAKQDVDNSVDAEKVDTFFNVVNPFLEAGLSFNIALAFQAKLNSMKIPKEEHQKYIQNFILFYQNNPVQTAA